MVSSTILRKHFSINCATLVLVLLAIVSNTLVLDVSAVSLGLHVGGVPEPPSVDLPVSSTEVFSSNVSFDQHTVLDKTYWSNPDDQTKQLNKRFGRSITPSVIPKSNTMSNSSTLDSEGINTPYTNLDKSTQSITAAACASSVIARRENDHTASDEIPQLDITLGLKDVIRHTQTPKSTTPLSNHIGNRKGTNQDILENPQSKTSQLHLSMHQKKNLQYHPEEEVVVVQTSQKSQLFEQQHGFFTPPIVVQNDINLENEYNSIIPITLYGTDTTVVSFKGHKGYIVNVVLQFRGHRYDPTVSEHNCENTHISAQLRLLFPSEDEDEWIDSTNIATTMAEESYSPTFEELENTVAGSHHVRNRIKSVGKSKRIKATSAKARQLENTKNNDADDAFYKDNQNRFWSSFIQLFDTSLLCEILPSRSLRTSQLKVDQTLRFTIQSMVQPSRWDNFNNRDDAWVQSNLCRIQVSISQTPAKQLKVDQILYAVVIPLLVLLLPLPFFLRRADIIQGTSLDINALGYMRFPPYFLRRSLIGGALYLKEKLHAAWYRRRRKALQKRLEMQQRALAARLNAVLVEVPNNSAGRPAQTLKKDLEIPLGFPIQPHLAEITSPLEAPEPSTRGRDASSPTEEEKERPSTMLVQLPIRRFQENEEAPGNPLSGTWTTAVVVKPVSHSTTEKILPSRPPREDKEGKEIDDDSTTQLPLRKRGTVDGTPAEFPPAAPYATGGNSQSLFFTTNSSSEDDSEDSEEDERLCRICRDGDGNLVAPCNCTGSVRWVHLSCLDHWRLERMKRNVGNHNVCEICKSPFKIKIRRSTIVWQGFKRIVCAIILIATCTLCFLLIPLISYSVFGEISCVAEYHRVPYATMYQFDGIILSLFVYVEIILAVILARLIVYSWFRSNPEVEAYIADVHVIPQFMTWLNKLKIAFVTLVIIAQTISIGYLIKYFVYIASNIGWNWEASPLLGGIVYILLIFVTIGVSVLLRERWIQSQNRRQPAAAPNIAVEERNGNNRSPANLEV
ncbi:unnamed protein product [Phytomonas sp. Hart1]|nr:unnamed protein product [Phytomonas sp. Hart1]|eukprot:CCW69854.1 unnamed protein product [Phytomonas sp. isolate Hart1]